MRGSVDETARDRAAIPPHHAPGKAWSFNDPGACRRAGISRFHSRAPGQQVSVGRVAVGAPSRKSPAPEPRRVRPGLDAARHRAPDSPARAGPAGWGNSLRGGHVSTWSGAVTAETGRFG